MLQVLSSAIWEKASECVVNMSAFMNCISVRLHVDIHVQAAAGLFEHAGGQTCEIGLGRPRVEE